MMSNTPQGGRIVVGVDGSPSSRAALRWAIHQAKLTGATIDAVTAWRMPASYAWTQDGVTGIGDYPAEAQRILTAAINELAGVDTDVKIRPLVEEGHPAQVLVEAAHGADLLVVGRRGHGGFSAALLGSVSQNCVHHAPCPVLVVRGNDAS
jgi:nucleotide-binding universal stress UspA family protein